MINLPHADQGYGQIRFTARHGFGCPDDRIFRAMTVAKQDYMMVRNKPGKILWWRQGAWPFIARVDHGRKRRLSFPYAGAS